MNTSKLVLPTPEEWVDRCKNDGEFMLEAQALSGAIRLNIGDETLEMSFDDGVPTAGPHHDPSKVLEYSADKDVWTEILAVSPKPFYSDLVANMFMGLGISRSGDHIFHCQYYGAVMRSVELLRPAESPTAPLVNHVANHGAHDSPVGRYLNLELADGNIYRIYYEEAGQGIPLLLQHTAGSNCLQWRHYFEMPEITSKYRLIAYDLPYRGKSLPPVGKKWWSEPYQLTGEMFRSVPVQLAKTLGLENPVFMGCSIGGLLALDLAYHHADLFKATISLAGVLAPDHGMNHGLSEFSHPQISDDYGARIVEGLIPATAPMPYRMENCFAQSSGWSRAMAGDLYYYAQDYDLKSVAHEIDTEKVGVHILSGEYDYSGTIEKGRAAHQAIKGSTFTEMKGIGHFPMVENPVEFVPYLMPVLESIASD